MSLKEETKTVAFRVPLSKEEVLKNMMKPFVDQWNRENKNPSKTQKKPKPFMIPNEPQPKKEKKPRIPPVITDETIMTYGKHRGKEFQEIPADYLIWLYEETDCPLNIKTYVEDNMDVLEAEIRRAKNLLR